MSHAEAHPQAGRVVTIQIGQAPPVEYALEDWWDRLTGGSWMNAEGNPAALNYAMRSGMSHLPLDNEVVYGKIGTFGHLVHVSEIVEAP